MDNEIKNDLANKMSALLERYHLQVEGWTEELRAFASTQEQWSDSDIQEITSISHKISGSGGTYGFPDLSQAGQSLERLLLAEERDTEAVTMHLNLLIVACEDALEQPPVPAEKEDNLHRQESTGSNDLPLLLIVEDDPATRTLVEALLQEYAQIVTAENAGEAFKILKQKTPSLVLLDDKMTDGMSGLEMLDKMKNAIETSNIPVVMLTGSTQPHQIMRGLVSGAADYITKPFDPKTLVTKIQNRLNHSQIRILIADDDEPVRELLAHKFRSAGCDVILAGNGQEAFDSINKSPPDLALLDRMMPGMDGLVVLRKMQETSGLENIPVIFLTAKHYEYDILEGLNQGAADYIVKPFNPDEVVVRCMRMVRQRK